MSEEEKNITTSIPNRNPNKHHKVSITGTLLYL
jgi:hypothetical protein